MNKINIYELQEYLNYKDIRAIRNWCKKNNVFIIRQGKNEFVFETNFKEEYERPFINKLKKLYGNDWESVYRLYADGDIPALNMLQQLPEIRCKTYTSINKSKNTFNEKFENYRKHKIA